MTVAFGTAAQFWSRTRPVSSAFVLCARAAVANAVVSTSRLARPLRIGFGLKLTALDSFCG